MRLSALVFLLMVGSGVSAQNYPHNVVDCDTFPHFVQAMVRITLKPVANEKGDTIYKRVGMKSVEYDNNGRVLKLVDSMENTIRTTLYDPATRTEKQRFCWAGHGDGDTIVSVIVFDRTGRVLRVDHISNSSGYFTKVRRSYRRGGNLIVETVETPLSEERIESYYDRTGRLLKRVKYARFSSRGKYKTKDIDRYSYDSAGVQKALMSTHYPGGGSHWTDTIVYTYDGQGRIRSAVQPSQESDYGKYWTYDSVSMRVETRWSYYMQKDTSTEITTRLMDSLGYCIYYSRKHEQSEDSNGLWVRWNSRYNSEGLPVYCALKTNEGSCVYTFSYTYR